MQMTLLLFCYDMRQSGFPLQASGLFVCVATLNICLNILDEDAVTEASSLWTLSHINLFSILNGFNVFSQFIL